VGLLAAKGMFADLEILDEVAAQEKALANVLV